MSKHDNDEEDSDKFAGIGKIDPQLQKLVTQDHPLSMAADFQAECTAKKLLDMLIKIFPSIMKSQDKKEKWKEIIDFVKEKLDEDSGITQKNRDSIIQKLNFYILDGHPKNIVIKIIGETLKEWDKDKAQKIMKTILNKMRSIRL